MKNKSVENLPQESELPLSERIPSADSPSWFVLFCRKAVFHQLSKFQHGKLTLIDSLGKRTWDAFSPKTAINLTVWVHDLRLYQSLVFNGSVGGAESYMRGEWECSDLTQLTRLFALNLKVLDSMEGGTARLKSWLNKGWHLFHRNTMRGSALNIAAHYDLSNEFFKTFLDRSMTYSSTFFETPSQPLEEAAWNKNERICQKLNLQPSDHVLEIGSGWGSFAIHAAQKYGCQVTATTISARQYELARQRVEMAGLAERVTVLQEDYRNLQGEYDKLVSVEMIEAVGHQYFNQYFETCGKLLKPDGMFLIQAITIDDRQYEKAIQAVDFIQRYIFPGGCLPSLKIITEAVKEKTDLRIFHLEDLASHYSWTLRKWRENFQQNVEQIRKLGFGEEFIRMWEYYFCYCEGGFTERVIGCLQILLTKPMCRRESLQRNCS